MSARKAFVASDISIFKSQCDEKSFLGYTLPRVFETAGKIHSF